MSTGCVVPVLQVQPGSRLRWGLLVLGTSAALSGCHPAVTSRPGIDPLRAGGARSSPHIDLRTLAQRPRLSLLQRDGDPAPAVAVAVAAQAGSTDDTALGALLAERMRTAGYPVTMRADGLGFQLLYIPTHSDALDGFFTILVQNCNKSFQTTSPHLPKLQHIVSQLYAHPRATPASAPVVACSGRLTAPAGGAPPDYRRPADRAHLEALRLRVLVTERMGIGVVGPRPLTQRAVVALRAAGGWRSGGAPEPQWPKAGGQHGAYLSANLALGQARLVLALRTPSALGAVGAAQRLGQPQSPLSIELSALQTPWQLTSVTAAAHPVGGCLTLTLRPRASLTVAQVPASAAEVAAAAQLEALRDLGQATSAEALTRQLLASPTAARAAALSAWWTVAGGRDAEAAPTMASALAVGGAGSIARPPADAELSAAYRSALQATPTPARPRQALELRLAVERGQGQLWVLVASPCALLDEGSWDAGRSALGAVAAAAGARHDADVTVAPWVSADGVGVLVHSGPRPGEEPAGALARRVARAAGRAFSFVDGAGDNIDRAKLQWLAKLDAARHQAYSAFAERASPDHPAWLAPWGSPARSTATTAAELGDRWRQIVHGPIRVAVLANLNHAQASAAAREVERWLVDARVDATCPHAERARAARAGVQLLGDAADGAGRLLVGATLPPRAPGAPDYAEQLVAAVAADDGLARRLFGTVLVTGRVLGGDRVRAIVFELRAPTSALAALRHQATEGLAALGTTGMPETLQERLPELAQRARRRRLARPIARLGALWRGTPRQSRRGRAIEAEAWRAWLGRVLSAKRLIVVTGEPRQP